MENLKGTVLVFSIFTTGLSAGLFYAWAVSVIPGTKIISDKSYLEAMQAINRAILNPWFFAIFVGPILLMAFGSYLEYSQKVAVSFWFTLSALIIYLAGTFGVTIFGNVPLNEGLDLVQINTLSTEDLRVTRHNYEGRWNSFHRVRTIFAVISFILLLLAIRFSNKPDITDTFQLP